MPRESNFPWFVVALSGLQMAVFAHEVNRLWSECGIIVGLYGPGISDRCSSFAYDPARRGEVWRHITHSFAHDGWAHLLTSSLLYNLVFGIPVERVHGTLQTCILYFTGVSTCSLICSVLKPDVGGIGGSAGTMALLGAVITMSYHKMTKTKIFAVFTIACEPIVFIYLTYFDAELVTTSSMQYIIQAAKNSDVLGHLAGFVTGTLYGLLALRKVEAPSWKRNLIWVCFFLWLALIVATVLINALADDWFPPDKSGRICKSICRDLLEESRIGKPITFWEGLQERVKKDIFPSRLRRGSKGYYFSDSLDEDTIRELRKTLNLDA